ncbi:hypothetical protein [Limosilactobacillus fermentum]|uniref:hypothetical protein n=1 Tax=Limosilactobacillus fermentum TaxID=1613 RepID=UPI003002F21E
MLYPSPSILSKARFNIAIPKASGGTTRLLDQVVGIKPITKQIKITGSKLTMRH